MTNKRPESTAYADMPTAPSAGSTAAQPLPAGGSGNSGSGAMEIDSPGSPGQTAGPGEIGTTPAARRDDERKSTVVR
jgi:hypothetical protein